MQINNPQHVWQLLFEGEWPTAVSFLENSRHIAAANRDGQIFIWQLPEKPPEPTGEESKNSEEKSPPDFAPVLKLDGHTNGITRLIATDVGKTLISASLDHTIRLWDLNASTIGSAGVVLDAQTRERKARGKSKEEQEKILNAPGITVSTLSASHVLEGHNDWIQALGISADGKRLISGDDRCLTIVWDLESREKISSWTGYERVWVTSAALSPDGQRAFTAEHARSRSDFDRPAAQARLWNANDGELLLDLLKVWTPEVKDEARIDSYGYAQAWGKLMKQGLVCAAFSPDGKLLAVGQGGETDKGQVHLVNVENGEIVRTISGHQYGVCDLQFSGDGNYLLSCGRDTQVRICQVSDGKEIAVLGTSRGGQFKDWLNGLSISPDQNYIAAADIAGMIQVWQLNS